MGRTKKQQTYNERDMTPALTPEARENQLINLATDLAEKQLRDGTASSQVITHFLKLGTVNHQLEMEKMRNENLLLEARTEALQSAKRIEDMYAEAMNAMRSYSGLGGSDEIDVLRTD